VIRAKRKKEEMARIRQLIDLAYNNDPRIIKFKKEDKEKKLAAKRAKQDAAQAQKAEEERQMKELQAAQKAAELAEQKRLEQLQKEKEQQKRALKKERKTFRDTVKANNYFIQDKDDKDKLKNMESVEKLCEFLKFSDLQDLNKKLLENPTEARQIFEDAVNEMEKQLEEERKQSTNLLNSIGKNTNSGVIAVNKKSLWTNENVQLLIKAVNIFPAGTNQRWDVVANFINQHATNLTDQVKFNAKDALNKAKDIQSSDFSKNELKTQVNQKAFESFERNKKELKVVDNSEISQKDDEEIKAAGESAAKLVKKSSKSKLNGMVNGQENKAPENPPQVNGTTATTAPAPVVESKPWTKEEQALLEQAIKTYSNTTPDRWDRIAECIPNRTKKECLKRVKELKDLVTAKQKAQQVK
jgi:DnaJ family protein C protein 2